MSVIEGADVVVNEIPDDVWGSEDELTGTFSDKVESCDWLCLYIRPVSFPMMNCELKIYNGNIMQCKILK